MKKLISFLLVGVLAISITACTAKEKEEETQTTTTTTTQAETTQAQSDVETVEVAANVLKTSDWTSYESAQYNGKDQMTINIALPEGYTVDGTIINDPDGKKYGEITGVVVLEDNQEIFDTIEANDTHNDIKYIEKETGEYEINGKLCPVAVAKAEAPTDDGQGTRYLYSYGVDLGDYCVEFTVYSDTELTDMPEEHTTLLSHISVA